jgi:hypothetical protein
MGETDETPEPDGRTLAIKESVGDVPPVKTRPPRE